MFRERFFGMKTTKYATVTAGGVLTVTVSAPAKVYTGISINVTASWDGGTVGPFTGDVNWGDGSTPTPIIQDEKSLSFNHTYSVAGTYTIKVTVYDNTVGLRGEGTKSIQIVAQLAATFSVSPTSGNVPLAVTFTIGTISGGYTPYSWDLDYADGSTHGTGTAGGTKAHTYTKVGTFTATLVITDALGAALYGTAVTHAGVTLPSCPIWMNTIHTFAVKYGLTRIRQELETLAESRECSLT